MSELKRCKECNNFILNIKYYSDSYLCSVDGKDIWCNHCFENYDFSFLFDKEKDLKEQSIKCLFCGKYFKYMSQERYIDQYKNNICISNPKICSTLCHKNIINYLKNRK